MLEPPPCIPGHRWATKPCDSLTLKMAPSLSTAPSDASARHADKAASNTALRIGSQCAQVAAETQASLTASELFCKPDATPVATQTSVLPSAAPRATDAAATGFSSGGSQLACNASTGKERLGAAWKSLLPANFFLPPAGKPSGIADVHRISEQRTCALLKAGRALGQHHCSGVPWAVHLDPDQMAPGKECQAMRVEQERQTWAAHAVSERPKSAYARHRQPSELCAADAMWFDQAAPLLHALPGQIRRAGLGRYCA